MDIILLEKIENVGRIGDKVSVKPGFARNYLIPQGKATLATPENIATFEARRAEIEAKAHGTLEAAQARAARIVRSCGSGSVFPTGVFSSQSPRRDLPDTGQ